ncbi:hypothetical protein GQ457_15G018660 [Hibiscus cannabinus]
MASARYALVSAKSRLEEQGFYLDDGLPNYGLEQFMHNRLRELGWFRFARQPAGANYNWVLEFYANNADGEDSSMVCGKRVPATTAIINYLLGLPNDAPSFYVMMGGFEEKDYEVIKNILCLPNTEWNTTGMNNNSVSRLSLLPETKLWNTFVKRNLMPTSHNQTVDRMRLLLINTIMTGFRVNVGEILAKELAAHCANDKGILAFPCLISDLCRMANVPMFDTEKYQAEKTAWTRAVYMRKMNVADATAINMVMPTPPAIPVHEADARVEDSAPPSPAEPTAAVEQHRTPPPSPPIIPVSSHTTTTSPATTPAAPAERSRGQTPETPLRSTPSSSSPSSPAPAQSDEAAPLQYMLLRSQLQRIEARQLHFQNDIKVFQQNLIKFLNFQFPSSAAFFGQSSTPPPNLLHLLLLLPNHPPTHPPRRVQPKRFISHHLLTLGPTTSTPAPAAPILSAALTPTTAAAVGRPTPDSPARKRGKATAGRSFGRETSSSPDEEEADQRPAKRRRRYHVITAESDDDDSSAEVPMPKPLQSADPSLSPSI